MLQGFIICQCVWVSLIYKRKKEKIVLRKWLKITNYFRSLINMLFVVLPQAKDQIHIDLMSKNKTVCYLPSSNSDAAIKMKATFIHLYIPYSQKTVHVSTKLKSQIFLCRHIWQHWFRSISLHFPRWKMMCHSLFWPTVCRRLGYTAWCILPNWNPHVCFVCAKESGSWTFRISSLLRSSSFLVTSFGVH